MLDEGIFEFFSNSFLVLVSKDELIDSLPILPIYAKYANERKADKRVVTLLYKHKDGRKSVFKCAGNNSSNKHIRAIVDNYSRMVIHGKGKGKFRANKCRLIEGKEPVPLVAGAT